MSFLQWRLVCGNWSEILRSSQPRYRTNEKRGPAELAIARLCPDCAEGEEGRGPLSTDTLLSFLWRGSATEQMNRPLVPNNFGALWWEVLQNDIEQQYFVVFLDNG